MLAPGRRGSAAAASVLLEVTSTAGERGAGGQAVWAGVVAARRCCDESYWVHPSAADAAVHAGAALRGAQDRGMMVSVAVGHYGVQAALAGKRPCNAWSLPLMTV